VNDLKDPDDPDELETLIEALGATPVVYDDRLRCCGFPIVMMNKTNSLQLSGNAILSAKKAGVDVMATPCPLCHLNLDSYQPEIESRMGVKLEIPILHIPQLVAMALGVPKDDLKLKTHIVRPAGALATA
jgi:succinate dehydrogenase / fumarate reductase cytochrome b subunit